MDSLTHIVLGAAIGEVTLGKKIGNKAILGGALISTIPDLDVLITPFLNPVDALFFHRGISHSLFAAAFLIPIIGYALSKIEKRQSVDLKTWIWFTSLPLLSHILIDCFNTYGTGIFEPFSNIRISYDSMAIIDVIFLLPLLAFTIWVFFIPFQKKIRRTVAWISLSFVTLYFLFTILNKQTITNRAKEQLQLLGISYNRILTTPVPLSNFIWAVVAENESGYSIGYINNFDKSNGTKLRYLPRNAELLGNLKDSQEVKNLIRFSKGFYNVERDSIGNIWMHDLRYVGLAIEDEGSYVFSFGLLEKRGEVEVTRSHPNRRINFVTIKEYFEKIF
ncbi:MAG: metal-dependent hydrolase [Bacteroidales bacterium]|nr:MAG: metal-dependent hydrolase [Bacteroidales bacterium]